MLRLDMHMIAGVLQYVAVASFAEAWIENLTPSSFLSGKAVASFAEAWIENGLSTSLGQLLLVASFAEAWIEKSSSNSAKYASMSPPSRRRGLKMSSAMVTTI